MYIKKSVGRATGATSPGAYKAKKPNVCIVDADDVVFDPGRDSKGVAIPGNFILAPNARMIRIYMTPETIEASFEVEGPEDGKVFKHMFKGEHPGESLEVKEFIQNFLGRPVFVFEENCRDNTMNVYGTKCSPLKISPTFTSNKEGTKHMISFEQPNPTEFLPGYYQGALTEAAYYAQADKDISATEANGNFYQMPAFAAAEVIDFAATDLDHGQIVSVIGGGGADPGTISTGAHTAVTVALTSGTQWIALDGAVINFRVFKAGAVTYFIEDSRS
jgi:hypothetical protein